MLFAASLFAMLMSCGDDDNGSYSSGSNNNNNDNSGSTDTTETTVNVSLSTDATFGDILVNAEGRTLYFFSNDASGQVSNCNGDCANAWPAFSVDELVVGDGLPEAGFGSVERNDGTTQITYKGYPLYTHVNDTNEGDINGDGVGGVWFVAKPDYSVMLSQQQLVGRNADGELINVLEDGTVGDGVSKYITDDRGNTLYRFINDEYGTNNFTAEDFSNNGVWPIYYNENTFIPSVYNEDDFGVIDVFGEAQLTFRGWPLYKFGQDESRGDTYGVAFPQPGIWPIVNGNTENAPDPANSIAASYDVTNQGPTAYIFNNDNFDNVANPDLTLQRGSTYEFVVNAPGHPFLIKSVQSTGTDNTYNAGVTNNGAAQGTVLFTVPESAPDTLYYNCEFHGSMTGTLTIVD